MINLNFQISEEAFELLKSINNRAAEYRDTEFSTLEEFKQSDRFKNGMSTEEWFLNRNYGGTYHIIDELTYYGLVECDGESWHITYVTTFLGKEVLKSNEEKYNDKINP